MDKKELTPEEIELRKKEGIKLAYIKLLNDVQMHAGTLKVSADDFKDDKEASEMFKEYGDSLSQLVSKLSAHIATL